MIRYKTKEHAEFHRDLSMQNEFIVGLFFDDAVKKSPFLINKGFIKNLSESFMQR